MPGRNFRKQILDPIAKINLIWLFVGIPLFAHTVMQSSPYIFWAHERMNISIEFEARNTYSSELVHPPKTFHYSVCELSKWSIVSMLPVILIRPFKFQSLPHAEIVVLDYEYTMASFI